jgi:hypothetical protein
MRCDFCCSPDVHWSFPARDFTLDPGFGVAIVLEHSVVLMMPPDVPMTGGWAACPACHALIIRGDRERLARRAARSAIKIGPEMANESLSDVTRHMRALFDKFWANREGAPSRIEAPPRRA